MAQQDTETLQKEQSALFRNIMLDNIFMWGFVVIITARGPNAWREALDAPQKQITAGLEPGEAIQLGLPEMHLRSAGIDAARESFNRWRRDYEEDGEGGWVSDVRNDVFLVLDKPALESLLSGDPEAAWVTMVDANPPSDADDIEYPGWMRCTVQSLHELYAAIDFNDEGMPGLCPVRSGPSQIPLYDGTPDGRLLEPGVDGLP
ncbi:hypothetical protein G7054_g9339 [Neopestalotiopsis clavispora]|nr:hypothetical protein G7054_g9339 [Neopestalotiopsis clavispora]